ncbi:peroxynitrite isomerase [Nocardia arthritidis]|uniref:peroxynitrite isomerase n=1 Tax=Nocardia arthritidis TaxID=228602 RepID=UPI00142E0319|nr:FABP family protein [Nocardia arthritidis]
MVEPQPPVAPHPAIAPLAPLLGTWRGDGQGEYPTIQPFGYLEEVRFGHLGRPFLTYRQRTRAADDGRPLHAETGYLRCPSPDRVELILAHPTGITEICEGSLTFEDGALRMELDSTSIGRSSTAKLVTALGRSIRQTGDTIDYTLRMAAVGEPMQHHLAASLKRAD